MGDIAAPIPSSRIEDGPKQDKSKGRLEEETQESREPTKLYYEAMTAKKGFGIFASQFIARGTLIISEPPLLVIPSFGAGHRNKVEAKTLFPLLRPLSPEKYEAFTQLHPNGVVHRYGEREYFCDIANTNAFCYRWDSEDGAVFQEISKINHSCHPSCHRCWNVKTNMERIYAVRDIKKGEELTVSYLNNHGVTQVAEERQFRLREFFGFQCKCELCHGLGYESIYIDEGFADMAFLIKFLKEARPFVDDPYSALTYTNYLYDDLASIGICDTRLAKVFEIAFEILATHSDKTRATYFARLAHNVWAACEGRDSPKALYWGALREDPMMNLWFGRTKMWKDGAQKAPTELATAAFERWLWRTDSSSLVPMTAEEIQALFA